MLVLTRRLNEALIIGKNIEITILDISNGNVKIGIEAPRDIEVLRKEIVMQIAKENIDASKNSSKIDLDVLIEKVSNGH